MQRSNEFPGPVSPSSTLSPLLHNTGQMTITLCAQPDIHFIGQIHNLYTAGQTLIGQIHNVYTPGQTLYNRQNAVYTLLDRHYNSRTNNFYIVGYTLYTQAEVKQSIHTESHRQTNTRNALCSIFTWPISPSVCKRPECAEVVIVCCLCLRNKQTNVLFNALYFSAVLSFESRSLRRAPRINQSNTTNDLLKRKPNSSHENKRNLCILN